MSISIPPSSWGETKEGGLSQAASPQVCQAALRAFANLPLHALPTSFVEGLTVTPAEPAISDNLVIRMKNRDTDTGTRADEMFFNRHIVGFLSGIAAPHCIVQAATGIPGGAVTIDRRELIYTLNAAASRCSMGHLDLLKQFATLEGSLAR